VVVEDVVAGLDVALLALVAEPLLVGVVFGVAALGCTRGVRLGELALGVTRLALVLEVLALEHERSDLALRVLGERLLVIELERVPRARGVAQHAVLAERAVVQRVLVALLRGVAVPLEAGERRLALRVTSGVAVGARDLLTGLVLRVALDQRERSVHAV